MILVCFLFAHCMRMFNICIKFLFLKKFSTFFSSPLAGKRNIVVAILVWCKCVRSCVCASVRPCEFVRTITCTIMHGFQNNVAQLLPLRRRSAI